MNKTTTQTIRELNAELVQACEKAIQYEQTGRGTPKDWLGCCAAAIAKANALTTDPTPADLTEHTSHTPGPWPEQIVVGQFDGELVDPNGFYLSDATKREVIRRYNSQPKLLAVLSQLCEWDGPAYAAFRALRGFQYEARAAIARAEGKPTLQ